MTDQSAENDTLFAALLLDYTRWLFDKQNITGGRFDYLPGKFMADREARVIPPEGTDDE